MTILEFFKSLNVGGWLAIFIAISSLVEIAPIKIYPIQWLGNRLNSGLNAKFEALELEVYEHIAQGYRDVIMSFQNGLLFNGCSFYTQEQYDAVVDACEKYESFCKQYKIKNDKCVFAIDYIKRCYKKCQDNQCFADLGEVE